MQKADQFIIVPGDWLGYGKIWIANVTEPVVFYTSWTLMKINETTTIGKQVIEQQGVEEHQHNLFRFSSITDNSFLIELENEVIGSVEGTGVIEANRIAWQFSQPIKFKDTFGFTGSEEYLLLDSGDFQLNAEYHSPDHITIVTGKLWRR